MRDNDPILEQTYPGKVDAFVECYQDREVAIGYLGQISRTSNIGERPIEAVLYQDNPEDPTRHYTFEQRTDEQVKMTLRVTEHALDFQIPKVRKSVQETAQQCEGAGL
jgi:hypothetical protein